MRVTVLLKTSLKIIMPTVQHAQDVLHLGEELVIKSQVFAQTITLENFGASEEGVFGLAFSMISSHNFPTPIH